MWRPPQPPLANRPRLGYVFPMKVRQKPRPSGKVEWKADLGATNGKRIQRYFNTRTEAEEWLRETKLGLKMEGQNAHLLSKADRTLFASWRDRQSLGTVLVPAQELAEARTAEWSGPGSSVRPWL